MAKTSLSSSVQTASQPRRLTWVLLALLAGYAAFLYLHVEAWAGGSDSSGYMNQARFLSEGKLHVPQRIPAGLNPEQFDWFTFVPLGFMPEPATQQMVPSYPIGLPLLLVGLAKLVGWSAAPSLTIIVCAVLGVALMIPLGRLAGLPRAWTWFGAFILATSPLYNAMSLQLFSDVPATTAASATVLCAWRGRTRRSWAFAAGALLALAVLIRPSNVVLIAPVAFCLGLDWRRWLSLGVGGLPGAVLMGVYNLEAYGGPLKSGYGDLGPLFSTASITPTLLHYAKWLPILVTPAVVLALALPWIRRGDHFARVLLVWLAAVLIFYVGYKHTREDWWLLRFVLPAFPPLIVSGLSVAHTFWLRHFTTEAFLRRARMIATAMTVAVFVQSVWTHLALRATHIGSGEAMYHGAIAWAREHLPANAVILSMQCTGALAYRSDFQIVRWDLLDSARFALVAKACTQTRQPLYAMLFDHEENTALALHLPGRWEKISQQQLISFWEWTPPNLP